MTKEKRQKRFLQKKRHIEKQAKIYNEVLGPYNKWIPDNLTNFSSKFKTAGNDNGYSKHRYHKMKALNCGDPNCVMCMNPRKAFGHKTMQEIKFECAAIEQINHNFISKYEWEDLTDPAMEW